MLERMVTDSASGAFDCASTCPYFV